MEKLVQFRIIEMENIFCLEPDFEMKEYETVKTTQMLTSEEEDEYAEKNINLVHDITNKWAYGRQDRDDIFLAAEQGLVKAIHGYDIRKNYKFSTFAHKCITNEIIFYLRQCNKHAQHCVSLESLVTADKDGKIMVLEDVLGLDEDIQRDYAHKEVIQTMRTYIDKYLSKEEREIIRCRFGLDTNAMTQLEVANLLNMSQANVSKRERNILIKLRIMMKAKLGDNIEL